jgi:predicted Zn finger-like uncharacterized protein
MIIECPSCSTRYLVQIGLFAEGGRQVRCALCKHEWHVKLPTAVDVVAPPPGFAPIPEPSPPSSPLSSRPPAPNKPETPAKPTANLPAVIEKSFFPNNLLFFLVATVLFAILASVLIVERYSVAKAFPELTGFYHVLGLNVSPGWEGLVFEGVKSELRYDGGTMKLFVDGTICNTTIEAKAIPDIDARALGPDKSAILSWRVDAPVPSIEPGGKIPFHTEIATPMERTIEDVYLEFISRKEEGNANP